jgi:hypothetical protein
MTLTPRLKAARLSISRLRIDLNIVRMQRNVYRDHAQRLAEAIANANAVYADNGNTQALHRALNDAMNLALMARDYDTLQTTTDPTIQEN